MSVPARSILFMLLSSACLIAQTNPNAELPKLKTRCDSAECKTQDGVAAANALPSVPSNGKWEVEDFQTSDASVNCSVVKYDSALDRPIIHLVCPERQVFAPLRVHLTLSWKDVAQIPLAIHSMFLDTSRVVRFKSPRVGSSSAELTFQDPNDSRPVKQWITFTEVNVGLVLPNK